MAKENFSEEDRSLILQAIKQAELDTSGELKVHIENHCKENVMDRAAFVFEQLEMHKTELRNGVLFYLAIKDHQYAILGDAGINQKVPEKFWDDISEQMANDFKAGEYAKGLANGIKMAGEQLKAHFPYQQGDVNELSDEISFGKDKES